MQRNPYNIDIASLPKLDGIYLSHSHCDHFDPYSLYAIYQHQSPDIILPETLNYLRPVLEKHLPGVKIISLEHKSITEWKGLELEGINFPFPLESNENDLLSLIIQSSRELLFIEVDAQIPDYEGIHEYLFAKFTEKSYERVVHLITRNELE